jgi:beta-lactamase regulating signal transducer with metallopeptidase domain
MADLLTVGVSNAVAALLLAVVAALAGRIFRRPALTHCLWLLVFLKLVTPPMIRVPLTVPQSFAEVPAPQPPEQTAAKLDEIESILALEQPQLDDEFESKQPVADTIATASSPVIDWTLVALAVWLSGSIIWWTLAGIRLCRFGRLLRLADPAPSVVQQRVDFLGGRLGLRRLPETRFVHGAVSPLLWSLGGAPLLLLPDMLWQKLSDEQRDTLLVHELAHLRRGDHWVRVLELVVLGLYWWHPVVWWARREIREAEEQCCDAWVVWTLPDAAVTYAATLVETLAFLSKARLPLPLAASGIGAVSLVRRRLTMILRDTPPRSLSRAGLLAVLGLGALLLPFLPTFGQTATPLLDDPPAPKTPTTDQPQGTAPKPHGFVSSFVRDYGMEPPAAPRHSAPLAEEIETARDQVDLAKAQMMIRQAQVAAAEVALKQALARHDRMVKLYKQGAVDVTTMTEAEQGVESLKMQLNVQRAELQEPEIRLRQAQRRLATLRKQVPEMPASNGSTASPRPTPAANSTAEDQVRKLTNLLEQQQAKERRVSEFLQQAISGRSADSYPRPTADPTIRRPQPNPTPRADEADAERLQSLEKRLDAVLSQVQALRDELQRMHSADGRQANPARR